MNRKKKGPALYELISANQPQQSSLQTSKPESVQDEEDNLQHNVLTPGRAIRVSVGSIGVIAAICIALIVISYTMGYRRGTDIAREDYANRLFEELPPNQPSPPQTTPVVENTARQPIAPVPTNAVWGAIDSDPRVAGHYYFSLMETSRDGALQLATFCRGKGLETYAVSRNNTRFYRVIALPSFTSRTDANVPKVLSKIHAIRKQWVEAKKGRDQDLKDTYLVLHE